MKQIEKFANESTDKFIDEFRNEEKWTLYQKICCVDAHSSGFHSGFQKALDCVILYLKYQHRFGTLDELDINFEQIQRIADTEVEE